jgi:hypothetical protein
LQYYGPTFLLWELSTPMLNMRWYFVSPRSHFCSDESTNLDRDWLDPQEKLGWDKKYPTLNLVNDLLFVFAFFIARIVFGTKSVRVPSRLYSFDFVSFECRCSACRLGGSRFSGRSLTWGWLAVAHVLQEHLCGAGEDPALVVLYRELRSSDGVAQRSLVD